MLNFIQYISFIKQGVNIQLQSKQVNDIIQMTTVVRYLILKVQKVES